MKRLIVNADDLGADEARNAGIFEAIQAGSVTSTSILPNGTGLEDALRRIRLLGRTKVSFGVHLNLSEGKPLSSDLRLLTGPDGFFLGKASTQRLLMHPEDNALHREVAREMSAQIQVLLGAGVQIHHLDGHQHIHIFPAAIVAAVEVAQEHRVPWMRIPEESPPRSSTDSPPPWLMEEAQRFSEAAGAARKRLKGTGIRISDHFRGLYLKGRLSPSLLKDLLHNLPEGLTELMVHPGRVPIGLPSGPFCSFSTLEREQELETLMDGDFRRALSETGVILRPFPEVES